MSMTWIAAVELRVSMWPAIDHERVGVCAFARKSI